MTHKDTTILIKYDFESEREPWICGIKNQDIPLKGKRFNYNSEGLILHILNHHRSIPYSHVTLKVEGVRKKANILKERSRKRVEKVKKQVGVSGERLGKAVEDYKISEERLEKAIKEYEILEKRLWEGVEEHRILKEGLGRIIEENGVVKEILGELVKEHNGARKELNLTSKLTKGKNDNYRSRKIKSYLRKRCAEKIKNLITLPYPGHS